MTHSRNDGIYGISVPMQSGVFIVEHEQEIVKFSNANFSQIAVSQIFRTNLVFSKRRRKITRLETEDSMIVFLALQVVVLTFLTLKINSKISSVQFRNYIFRFVFFLTSSVNFFSFLGQFQNREWILGWIGGTGFAPCMQLFVLGRMSMLHIREIEGAPHFTILALNYNIVPTVPVLHVACAKNWRRPGRALLTK